MGPILGVKFGAEEGGVEFFNIFSDFPYSKTILVQS